MEKDRKLQIIRAADKRFSKHGLGKTTLDEIARDLRIGKATIYHYFESKEELFYETITWEAGQIIEEIKSIFNDQQNDMPARFIEYLNFKEALGAKYRLVYELFIMLLKDDVYEKESEIMKGLLKQEEEVLNLAFSALYTGKIENMNPSVPYTFVMESWGGLASNKLSTAVNKDKDPALKEKLFKFLLS